MPEVKQGVTYVFFSKANHDEWDGKGTVQVTDEQGVACKANYFGGLAAGGFKLIPGSGDTSPPNPESYVCLGKMENGVLKSLAQDGGPA